jgi:P27 family predicted phage terminase small subunit
MSVGRPPKPTKLHVVQGTYRPDRHDTNEPTPDVREPEIPSWLSAKARGHWRKIAPLLVDMGVLTTADGTALALLCDSMADYIEISRTLKAEGLTYTAESRDGVRVVKHPLVQERNEAWKRVHRMAVEFGLTPSARRRVSASGEQNSADAFEQWERRQA